MELQFQLIVSTLTPFLLLGAFAVWEHIMPCRTGTMPKRYRWGHVVALRIFDKLFFRVLLPFSHVTFALLCMEKGWGLFNQFTIPTWLSITVGVLLLDLGSYGIHFSCHKFPFLWRVHRAHHMDTEFDITTALRTHPLDDTLYSGAQFALIALFGLHPAAVVIFATIVATIPKFTHVNVLLPEKVDRWLRYFIATPNMHRIHHSAIRYENDSNYCAHFTFWDRIFGTYRPHPKNPHATMRIGLQQYRDDSQIRVDRFLLRPFHDKE